MPAADRLVVGLDGLQQLLDALAAGGRRVLGPVVRDGVVTHADIRSVDDLPRGVGDRQEPGRYAVRDRDDDALFGYAATVAGWKAVLFPARHLLWRGHRTDGGFTVETVDDDARPLALVGVRGCDLAAIGVQDRVLRDRLGGRPTADPHYAAARSDVLVVAVTCGSPADTCFCAAAGTGPRPGDGADLVLTELLDGEHRFIVEATSPAGADLLAGLPGRPVTDADDAASESVVDAAVAAQQRRLPPGDLRDLLLQRPEHPAWDEVARRCLACANCTLSCPTCFCTAVDDVTDLTGDHAERWRVWDSCFTAGFSYIHGGSVRSTTRSRYRQWMTHKFGTWVDQFGTSGCVGCGRCIAWCPAAIDVTAQLHAVAGSEA